MNTCPILADPVVPNCAIVRAGPVAIDPVVPAPGPGPIVIDPIIFLPYYGSEEVEFIALGEGLL